MISEASSKDSDNRLTRHLNEHEEHVTEVSKPSHLQWPVTMTFLPDVTKMLLKVEVTRKPLTPIETSVSSQSCLLHTLLTAALGCNYLNFLELNFCSLFSKVMYIDSQQKVIVPALHGHGEQQWEGHGASHQYQGQLGKCLYA